MIVQEVYEERPDGTVLIRTFSDANKYIRKVGTVELYEEAIDIEPVRYEYEETDMDIEPAEYDDEPDEPDDETEDGTATQLDGSEGE